MIAGALALNVILLILLKPLFPGKKIKFQKSALQRAVEYGNPAGGAQPDKLDRFKVR